MNTPSTPLATSLHRFRYRVILWCLVGGLAAGRALSAEPDKAPADSVAQPAKPAAEPDKPAAEPAKPQAQSGKPPAETEDAPLVEIEARFVHANEKQILKAFGPSSAIDKLGAPLTSDQAATALRALAALKADFFSSLRTVSKSGQHAVVETIREVRYPTEFERSKDEPGKSIPVAFETRNVGVTFEFDASVKGSRIHLSIMPRIVRFLGFIDYAPHAAAAAKIGGHSIDELLKRGLTEGGIWQPIFLGEKLSVKVQMESGDTILVGEIPVDPSSKEVAPNSPRTFVFMTARILPLDHPFGEPHPEKP